ncbi:lytic polysaccharide monooxygenase [Streptomyces sp. NPDC059525]|uniref:lytic polysaccharide monooxygenase n=1 Tax=Streptomyces sp. NPDC059525 TaxID=3346857 RepID=UPI003698AE7A
MNLNDLDHLTPPMTVSTPATRQNQHLMPGQNWIVAGKFPESTRSGQTDKDSPEDIPNNPPPADGKFASCGNPIAAFLDEVTHNGNPWPRTRVTSGQAVPVSLTLRPETLVRRIYVVPTIPAWNPQQKLTRAQFAFSPDVTTYPYYRLFDAAPYYTNPARENILNGGLALVNDQFSFTFNLPAREVGPHSCLLVVECANTGDALYQLLDFEYVVTDTDDK